MSRPTRADDEKESAPLAAEEKASVDYRYDRKFPGDPVPVMYWHAPTYAKLVELMEAAIVRGVPLTSKDLLDAQGLSSPPDDAEV
jgi:hypothetical protein